MHPHVPIWREKETDKKGESHSCAPLDREGNRTTKRRQRLSTFALGVVVVPGHVRPTTRRDGAPLFQYTPPFRRHLKRTRVSGSELEEKIYLMCFRFYWLASCSDDRPAPARQRHRARGDCSWDIELSTRRACCTRLRRGA